MPAGEGLVARAFPWGEVVGVRWALSSAGCGAALAATWWFASGKGLVEDQIVAVAVAVTLLVVVGCTHASMVLQGRRLVGARRARLLADGLAVTRQQAPAAVAAPDLGAEVAYAVAGLRRFHRPGCPMLDGRAATAAPAGQHLVEGRQPCGVCQPVAAPPLDPDGAGTTFDSDGGRPFGVDPSLGDITREMELG